MRWLSNRFPPRSRLSLWLYRLGTPSPLSKQLLRSGQLDGTNRYRVLGEHSAGPVDLQELGQAWILDDLSVIYMDPGGVLQAGEIIDKDDPYWWHSEQSDYLIWHLDPCLAKFLGVDRRLRTKDISR